MAVDRAVVDIDVVLIGGVHELVAVLHHAGPCSKGFQDQEFGDGQRHILAVPFHPVAGRVHLQPTAHDRVGRRFVGGFGCAADLRAAQDGADARDQQPLREGLGDIIIRAHGQAQRLIQLVRLGGQEDDRHLALFAQAAQQFQPVHLRHLDVEHAKVGRIFGQRLQRSFRVGIDARDEPFGLQRDRHRRQDILVIIHQRDGCGHAASRNVMIKWVKASSVRRWLPGLQGRGVAIVAATRASFFGTGCGSPLFDGRSAKPYAGMA